VLGSLGRHFEANSLWLPVIWRIFNLADLQDFDMIQRHGLAQLISRLRYPLRNNFVDQGPIGEGYVPLRLPEIK
jgi:hypothetical protein